MGSLNKFLRKSPGPLRRLVYRIVPFGRRYGPLFKKTLALIEETQFVGVETMRKVQESILQSMVRFVYDTVPYWNVLCNEIGAEPGDINLDTLSKLPILEKETVREKGHIMTSCLATRWGYPDDRVDWIRTSGSTGEPLKIFIQKDIYETEAAWVEHVYNAHGSTLMFDRSVWLRHYVPEQGGPLHYWDAEKNRLYLSAYDLSLKTAAHYLSWINESRAPLLVAYPSSAYLLACLFSEVSLPLRHGLQHLRAIHTSSEMMLPGWREKIEGTFGVPVYEHYGQLEKVCLFYQCDKSDYWHEAMEYGITEIVDSEIIATGFINPYMPLIRYRTGDYVEDVGYRTCACGRETLRIGKIHGRTDDFLRHYDGYDVPGVNFYTMFYKIKDVRMFRLIQPTPKHLQVEIVLTRPGNGVQVEKTARNEILKRLGEGMRTDVKFVDEIPRSWATGKVKVIERRIP